MVTPHFFSFSPRFSQRLFEAEATGLRLEGVSNLGLLLLEGVSVLRVGMLTVTRSHEEI